MKLQKTSFDKIANGQKTIESRVYDEKRQQINIGDQIEFAHNDDLSQKILTKVKALHKHLSFENLFNKLPPEKFGGNSKQELLDEIEKFYSKEEQQKYGVIGVEIELLN